MPKISALRRQAACCGREAMRIEIVWHGAVTPVDLLDGVVTVGGGEADGVRLLGLPPALLELTVAEPRLSVITTRALVIGGARFPPHLPRLVLAGDRVVLNEQGELRRPALAPEHRQRMETAHVAKALLQGIALPLGSTRAATLTCVTGIDAGTAFPLAFSQMVVGRADAVEVRLHDRSVSRQHAKLSRRRHHFFVESGSTTNGLYVNGRRVRRRTQLHSGDVLELGQTVLRFDGPEQPYDEVTVLVAADPTPVPPGPTVELPELPQPEEVRRSPRTESGLVGLGVFLAATGAAIVLKMLAG